MLILTWILTVVLALAYLASGVMKLTKPRGDLPRAIESTIGGLEILGAIGLILPVLTGIAVVLTPIAAFALVVLQISAITFHLSRREKQSLPVNAALLLIALFVGLSWLLWV